MVVLVARHLSEVIFEHADAFAQGLDDPQLPVGVVVGPQLRPPEHEIVGAPAARAVQLVLHDGDQCAGEHLAADECLIRRETRRDVEVDEVVALLREVQRDGACKDE